MSVRAVRISALKGGSAAACALKRAWWGLCASGRMQVMPSWSRSQRSELAGRLGGHVVGDDGEDPAGVE